MDLTLRAATTQIKAEAAFGGPIGDTVSGRLSAAIDEHDGWTENRFVGAPDYNEQAIRWRLRGRAGSGSLSDAARILLFGQLFRQRCRGRRMAAPGDPPADANGAQSVPAGTERGTA